MKKLASGTEVPERIYYYLLNWNDEDNKEFMTNEFQKNSLSELSDVEFRRLFNKASTSDYLKLSLNI
jgi:hypothetical protein